MNNYLKNIIAISATKANDEQHSKLLKCVDMVQNDIDELENKIDDLRDEISYLESTHFEFPEFAHSTYGGLLKDICIKLSHFEGDPHKLEKHLMEAGFLTPHLIN